MLTHTAEFNTAVKATVRKFHAKLEITWTDPFIDPYLTYVANDENRINWPQQTYDLVETSTHKWAHLDGVLKPNGTYYPAPSVISEIGGAQMGWYGQISSGVNGTFAEPYPELELSFSERPIFALLVVGDSAYNEYPVDFIINIFDELDNILYTETVVGNTLLRWSKSLIDESIFTARKMTLTISKWSKADRVVKILEFYTSYIEIYEDEDIISMNLLEEKEVKDGSLPIGNISSNELDISLQNLKIFSQNRFVTDPFFPANPLSHLHLLVKKNRKIRAWIGVELPDKSIEYQILGTFWSDDWTVEEPEFSASTSCRDRMEGLRNALYSTSELYENITLYDFAEIVLNSARDSIPMPELTWAISTKLINYVLPYAWFTKKSYMECLKDIAEVCLGYAYMSREDVLILGTDLGIPE